MGVVPSTSTSASPSGFFVSVLAAFAAAALPPLRCFTIGAPSECRRWRRFRIACFISGLCTFLRRAAQNNSRQRRCLLGAVSGGASCIISHAIDNASAEERSFPSARRRASPESASTARLGATFSCWSPEPLPEPPQSRSFASSPLSSGPSRLTSAPAACAFPEVVPATSRSSSAATRARALRLRARQALARQVLHRARREAAARPRPRCAAEIRATPRRLGPPRANARTPRPPWRCARHLSVSRLGLGRGPRRVLSFRRSRRHPNRPPPPSAPRAYLRRRPLAPPPRARRLEAHALQRARRVAAERRGRRVHRFVLLPEALSTRSRLSFPSSPPSSPSPPPACSVVVSWSSQRSSVFTPPASANAATLSGWWHALSATFAPSAARRIPVARSRDTGPFGVTFIAKRDWSIAFRTRTSVRTPRSPNAARVAASRARIFRCVNAASVHASSRAFDDSSRSSSAGHASSGHARADVEVSASAVSAAAAKPRRVASTSSRRRASSLAAESSKANRARTLDADAGVARATIGAGAGEADARAREREGPGTSVGRRGALRAVSRSTGSACPTFQKNSSSDAGSRHLCLCFRAATRDCSLARSPFGSHFPSRTGRPRRRAHHAWSLGEAVREARRARPPQRASRAGGGRSAQAVRPDGVPARRGRRPRARASG